MDRILEYLQSASPERLVDLLVAVGILVVGWLVALLVALVVRISLKKTEIDNKLAAWLVGEENADGLPIERWIARAVFWILMLFVVIGFFQVLGLTVITEPLNRFLIKIFEYLPNLIGPVVLVLVAWVVATGLRFFVRRVLGMAKVDQRLGDQAGLEEGEQVPLTRTLSDAVYWLVFLLFLPAVLSALKLDGLLQPVQGMIDEMLAFLPNLFAALPLLFGASLLLLFAFFVGRVVSGLISNLLTGVGFNGMLARAGIASERNEGERSPAPWRCARWVWPTRSSPSPSVCFSARWRWRWRWPSASAARISPATL